MKKLTTFLCTLALLFGVVGGVKAQDPGTKIYEKDWTAEGSYNMWSAGFTEGKSIGIVSSALQVVNVAPVNNWELQYFAGDGCPVKKGANYVVRIGIKGSKAGSLTCVLGGWDDNRNTSLAFTTTASDVDVTIKDMPGTVANAHVMLQSGAFGGTLTITKVQVFELESVDTYGDAIATSDYTKGTTVGWKSDDAPDPTYDGTDGLTITNTKETKTDYWKHQYSVVAGSVDVSKEYIMLITAKGTSAANIHCNFANARDGIFGVTTDWSTAEVQFGTPDATDWRGVNIQTGDYVGTINVKNASLHPVVEGRLVEVGDAGYSTFSANKAVKMRGVTAYAAKFSGGSIVLTPVTEIPAGAGVIIEAAADNYKVPVIESASDLSDNDLLVSDGSITGDGSTIYALGKIGDNVGFAKVKSGVTIPAGKAYLVINSGAREFIGFGIDDEPTAVKQIESSKMSVKADNQYYNLAGQRVTNPTKGIYIVNGKKIIK